MPAARDLLERLLEGADLTQPQAEELLGLLTEGTTPPALIGAVLAALRAKGAVAAEVRGFAEAMRRLARQPALPPGIRAIDIVGTGGDSSGSFNISTGTALLTAACGLPVIKHGNRSVSSRAGSADVLEALGLPMPLDERAAGECLGRCGFTFLFAPHYHAATQAVAAARRALGVRTVFNILGPLTNPAQPPLRLIGAFSLPVAQLMAEALEGMHIERAFVIHGAEGWDEPTPVGPFTLFDVRPGQVTREERTPEDYGLPRCPPAALAGGDARHNAAALRAVLDGEAHGAHRDCLLLGAALALEVAGEARSAREGIERAAQAIDGGAAARVVRELARTGATREQ
ncbi:MAG: anthranilate phosphoribosyltransferase [Steroidobacteraceae bacterium]|jgi:anthranilate phosphoribosyltransferase